MSPNPQFPADLVAFTQEILNGKLNFLCSDNYCLPIKINFTPLHRLHPNTLPFRLCPNTAIPELISCFIQCSNFS